jgi:hypothetical protein
MPPQRPKSKRRLTTYASCRYPSRQRSRCCARSTGFAVVATTQVRGRGGEGIRMDLGEFKGEWGACLVPLLSAEQWNVSYER